MLWKTRRPLPQQPWWEQVAGTFKDDALFAPCNHRVACDSDPYRALAFIACPMIGLTV